MSISEMHSLASAVISSQSSEGKVKTPFFTSATNSHLSGEVKGVKGVKDVKDVKVRRNRKGFRLRGISMQKVEKR